MKKVRSLVLAIVIASGVGSTAYAQGGYNVNRLYGLDRYKTSVSISTKFTNEPLENVIIASGKNFPDALSGSVLSKKLNAPTVLVGSTVNESKDSINYIDSHLDKNGTVYILGGQGVVSEEIINNMKSKGYKNFVRLGGKDRFDTNKHIVNFMKVEKHTPVVIVNAFGFADALSISSVAASKGYPIIMTSNSKLSTEAKNMIGEIQPSEVYIIGGYAAVGDKVVDEVKNLVPSLEKDKIIKLAGTDRFDTSLKICNQFNLETDTAVIANGLNFPDALSGSALATKFNAPIILSDGKDISKQREFLDSKSYANIFLLGGAGAVDLSIEYLLKGAENTTKEERDYINKLVQYVDKYGEENINTSNEMMSLFDNILSGDILEDLENPNTAIRALDQFADIYKNCNVALNNYKTRLITMKDEVSNLGNLNGLESLSLEYINAINIEIKNVDKVSKMMTNFEGYFRNLKNAMISGDPAKIQKALENLENVDMDVMDELSSLEDGQKSVDTLKDKLTNIQNLIKEEAIENE